MKLAALFAKFLYQHKELRLPGLGIFTLDPSIIIPESTDKNYHEFTRNIQFRQTPVPHADDKFIDFIRTETGKIRPLAESDLDSFLSDGKILLNIGKPFHLEGIGYLQKNRDGRYEFTPGDTHAPKPNLTTKEAAEDTIKPKEYYPEDSGEPNNLRKVLMVAGAVVAAAVVIWLGYTLYTRNTAENVAGSTDSVVSAPDSTSSNVLLDSVQNKIDSVRAADASTPGTYRFVIERTANKARAIRRFNQIKDNLTDIRMDAHRDSTSFALYFVLPARASDTARIRDSLKVWYGRKNVWVEKR